MIWSSDLLFDSTWPSFELDRDFVEDLIVSKFEVDSTENVGSRVFTRFFFYDLILWPTFWPSNLSKILSRTSLWASLKLIGLKMWPVKCSQGYSMHWYSDLIFDPRWHSFELEIWSRTYFWASLRLIRLKMWPLECSHSFSMIWSSDLLFDPTTQFQTCPRFCKGKKHSEQVRSWFRWICGLKSVHKDFSMIWSSDLLFHPTWSSFELGRDLVEDIIVSKFELD